MEATVNYYQILQVRFDAEKSDIISSYKRLCKMYHPDISTLPHAQEKMAQINAAYDTLCDDQKRQAYDISCAPSLTRYAANTSVLAQAALTDYFDLLLSGQYEKAYLLLCESDRRRVSEASFVQWRQAVQELYGIREFDIRRGQHISGFKIGPNRAAVTAIKFFVDVLEKDHASGRLEHYCFSKYVVFEQGRPGIYLGYRDLSEISKQFDSRAREREKDMMLRHWQNHLECIDRVTGLCTRAGLLEQCQRELYRAQRFGSPLIVAALTIKPAEGNMPPLSEPCLEALAQTLQKSLRLTDTPCHLGGGSFIVLFGELKKRHAAAVIERLLKRVAQTAQPFCKGGVATDYSFELYTSGPLEPYLNRLAARPGAK